MSNKLAYPMKMWITNEVTKEIISTTPMKENETVEVIPKKRELAPQQKVFLNNTDTWRSETKKLGGFVNMQYVKNELLYNELNLDLANITRLIYLSTYLEYDMNRLIYHGHGNKKIPMDRNKIKEVLGITGGTFDRFYKSAKDSGILIKNENGEHFLNANYFGRGKVHFEGKYTKIFRYTTRSLYENSMPRQHKILAYVFRLIPTLDYKANKVCDAEGKPMNLKQIGEFLGIKDKGNMSKIAQELYKIKVEHNGEVYHLFRRVVIYGEGKSDFFVANPKIVYGGNGHTQEEMEETLANLVFKEELK